MERPKVKVAITPRPPTCSTTCARESPQDGPAPYRHFIEHAVRGQLAAQADFDLLIDEMLAATGGPPTKKERAAARRLLSGSAA